MRAHALATGLLALAAASGAPGCSDAEDRRLLVGRSLYDRHCSECHGLSTSGPAPETDLGFEVPDLRRLAEPGEPFPQEKLARYIDGRHGVREDAPGNMPVWGDRLYRHLPDSVEVEEMKLGAVNLILDWLETRQVAESP